MRSGVPVVAASLHASGREAWTLQHSATTSSIAQSGPPTTGAPREAQLSLCSRQSEPTLL